jgi:hypothetical protein
MENIPDYISAGVLILGGSFSMIDKETFKKIVDEQNYDLLANEIKKVKGVIDACRSKRYPGLNFKSDSLYKISSATGRNFNIGRLEI